MHVKTYHQKRTDNYDFNLEVVAALKESGTGSKKKIYICFVEGLFIYTLTICFPLGFHLQDSLCLAHRENMELSTLASRG